MAARRAPGVQLFVEGGECRTSPKRRPRECSGARFERRRPKRPPLHAHAQPRSAAPSRCRPPRRRTCRRRPISLDRPQHTISSMWTTIREFTDIKYERTEDGIAKITINRPEVRNALRPLTVSEAKQA